jgi:Na+/phosphate symporter
MLISLLTQHPEALPTILGRTPTWVWGLLAALMALGATQLRRRQAGLRRVVALPAAMVGLSAYSLGSALSASGQVPLALAIWLVTAALTVGMLVVWRAAPPSGTRYNAAHRSFDLPGSAIPLLLILAIFFTKYAVGVELAMQPAQAHNIAFAFTLAGVYGFFSGVFAARTVRLVRLARATTEQTPGHSHTSAKTASPISA